MLELRNVSKHFLGVTRSEVSIARPGEITGSR